MNGWWIIPAVIVGIALWLALIEIIGDAIYRVFEVWPI